MIWNIDGNGTKSFRFWRFQFIIYRLSALYIFRIRPWRIRGNVYLDIYAGRKRYVLRFQFTERDEKYGA
jgi:hypothetical protein